MAQKLHFELEFFSLERLSYNLFLFFSFIVLAANLNVTARRPGCIHHLTLFLLGWLVREFAVCRKVLCFGKHNLFQVDWNAICRIWQSEWNKVQEVFIAAWKEISSDLTFTMLEVLLFTKGHVLTFLTDSSSGCSATTSSMVIYDFVSDSYPFFWAASCSGPSLTCVVIERLFKELVQQNKTPNLVFLFFLLQISCLGYRAIVQRKKWVPQ